MSCGPRLSSSRTLGSIGYGDEISVQNLSDFTQSALTQESMIPLLLPGKFSGADSSVLAPKDVTVSDTSKFQVCGYAYACWVLEVRGDLQSFSSLDSWEKQRDAVLWATWGRRLSHSLPRSLMIKKWGDQWLCLWTLADTFRWFPLLGLSSLYSRVGREWNPGLWTDKLWYEAIQHDVVGTMPTLNMTVILLLGQRERRVVTE